MDYSWEYSITWQPSAQVLSNSKGSLTPILKI